ncbi:hypothetical protein [Amylibacter sp. SFDW26]|uniref:hypothetical protein n=1 Tax=Amylibacter sp. SFDW26 TaxID=2652722 RepID=UPI00186A10FE|nr:hypothetical protein [Amylibacter sp. SFDW26]
MLAYFGTNPSIIPMSRIVRFAIAAAMRQEEICLIGLGRNLCPNSPWAFSNSAFITTGM